MVEELEQLAKRVNNGSAGEANLEVRLSTHLTTQRVCDDLAHNHLCQLDFARALSEYMLAQCMVNIGKHDCAAF